MYDPENTFFTSDEHYGHGNIISYCARPFKNVREMDKVLLNNYNETVNEKSIVFHTGDFSLIGSSRVHFYEKLVEKMRPVKSRHFILGNHDEIKPFTYVNIGLFTTVHTAFWFNFEKWKIVIAHDPAIYQPAIYDSIMLCGHIHKLFKTLPKEKLVNVGVDVWDFKPVSLATIMHLLQEEGKL
jgi:calcineurin-like phosphoesterase family protein